MTSAIQIGEVLAFGGYGAPVTVDAKVSPNPESGPSTNTHNRAAAVTRYPWDASCHGTSGQTYRQFGR